MKTAPTKPRPRTVRPKMIGASVMKKMPRQAIDADRLADLAQRLQAG